MRKIIRTAGAKVAIVASIGAAVAIVAVMATSGAPADTGGDTMAMPQERGALTSIEPGTWRALGTYSGDEIITETVNSVMGASESDWFDDYDQGDQLDEKFSATRAPLPG